MYGDLMTLLWGAFGVLVATTALGQALTFVVPGGSNDIVLGNFNARVLAWWSMTIVIGLASLIGQGAIIFLFGFLSFAALREFLTLTTKHRSDHLSLAAAFFVVLPAQYYLIWIGWYGLYSIFVPVYVFLMLPMISALRGRPENFLIRIAETQWALMIAVFCISHIPALLNLDIPSFEGRNILLIIFLIVVVQVSDTLQYVWSHLMGEHRLAPQISSIKTIEGLIGSTVSGALVGFFLFWITPFGPLGAMAMAALISLLGFFGSFVMSAIKRDRGIRDWGPMVVGHGGFIDRLDGVIFAAPIFFHFTRFWWAA